MDISVCCSHSRGRFLVSFCRVSSTGCLPSRILVVRPGESGAAKHSAGMNLAHADRLGQVLHRDELAAYDLVCPMPRPSDCFDERWKVRIKITCHPERRLARILRQSTPKVRNYAVTDIVCEESAYPFLFATQVPSERPSTRIRPLAESPSIQPVINTFTGPGAPFRLSFGHSPANNSST
jgi:hypothetical protein